jgi:hypothetical protein
VSLEAATAAAREHAALGESERRLAQPVVDALREGDCAGG